ncbi:hypothetical protein [Cupriavidus basilensis]|uniref:hypothetical protein n=1 Tax=Cupriavidus basilensis TaxID=68895 RepID=UPI0012DFED29|nr:hypothetical protein [Cupriavidus basilensis]
MGLIVMPDPDLYLTPRVSTNATGSFAWGRKHEEALSMVDLQAILSYCWDEGYRHGRICAVRSRAEDDIACANFFHRSLLDGLPHAVFERSFRRGANDQIACVGIHVEDEASGWWDGQ